MLAVWAETGLVLADAFRDGNVPTMMSPLTVAQRSFDALGGNLAAMAIPAPTARFVIREKFLTAKLIEYCRSLQQQIDDVYSSAV